MSRVVIVSALAFRDSAALHAQIDRFRAFGDVEVEVVTLGPLTHWREGDPVPVVLDARLEPPPSSSRRLGRSLASWRMARLLRRSKPAQAVLRAADYVYVDQPAAVLAASRQTRRQPTGQFFTSAPRIERLLARRRQS
jgi:hypothetical protein